MKKIVLDYMNCVHTLKKNNSLAMKLNKMKHAHFAVLGSVKSRAEPSGLKVCIRGRCMLCGPCLGSLFCSITIPGNSSSAMVFRTMYLLMMPNSVSSADVSL